MMNTMQKEMLCNYSKMLSEELYKDLSADPKGCYCDYNKHKMLASIINTIHNIDEMLDSEYEETTEPKMLTSAMAHSWVDSMENSDDTMGAHWTMDQTSAVAKQYGVMFDHISECDWYTAMNMIYSDYGKTLKKAGITDVGVFVDLTKDFLFDKDAVNPKEKLYLYYKYIVKKD